MTDYLEYFSHTILGSLVFCLPVGLLTLWIFRQVRAPLISTLPNPHRDILLSIRTVPPGSLVQVMVSLLLGSWLHIAWDSFTHDHSWLVRHSVLSSFTVGRMPLNHLLWLLSSLIGVAVPLVMYLALVRRRRTLIKSVSLSEWRAYTFWLGIILLPFAGALPLTFHDKDYSRNTFVSFLAMYYFSCCYLTLATAGFLIKYRRTVKVASSERLTGQVL